jgi:WD40 repeat protein/serine/threonine protein kinase/TPR repeat protein
VTVENWERVKELLDQVIALAPEQRSRFLDEACASDSALRAELESLLSYGEELNSDFLRSPLTGELDQNVRRIEAAGSLTSGQVFEQRFQLIRKLGEGGMGQVWLAEQLSPMRRPVALKLIKAGMYDEAVAQRFQSERQSLAIMDHPAIAKVFDAGTTPQGQPYLVMEYVPGLPITDYCDQHKLPIKNRLELFIQACEGVQHAHQKAVIHRDLKPANILVVDVDGKAVPRIIDFGLARASTPKLVDQTLLTRFGQLMGTPGYMSPEQLDPNVRDIDTRTDVYSLGVILYVLLTGLQPFETKRRQKPALDELLRQLREEDPPTPSAKVSAHRETATASASARGTEPRQLARQLGGDLDWVTMKALDRDRERRYATPLELGADLRRHLQDEPVVARPASAVYQIRKYIRRHRVAAAAVGTVTLLAIVASGAAVIAVHKQHQAEREQLRAEFQQHQADYQAMQALQAQSRLLTLTAAQRLRDADVTGAQGIILEVLRHPAFAKARTMAANSVFQDIRAADALFAVLSGHDDIVTSAAFSPDGTRIVTASRDQTARIWSAQTGAQLGVLRGHSDVVQSAAYSPDGTRIVTASGDKTARIWDAQLGVQLAVLSGHSASIRSAAYSPDGTRIITASHDKTARIWDARTGAQLAVLEGHLDRVESAAYSPDGRRIVTASADKTARIWDARTGARIAVLAGHGYSVWSAAFSPDGTRVLSASNDTTARVWDVRTGRQLLLLSGHGDAVRSAAYSFDGTRIVTASDDKTVRIWDAITGSQLSVLAADDRDFMSAAYSPDGTRIVTASDNKTARIWNARTNAQLTVLGGHSDAVACATYSPDGERIVTASIDRTARIWDARNGAQLEVLRHGDTVFTAGYSPDATRIVTASSDKTALIWDARTAGKLLVLSGHGDHVFSAAFSPDGARIVTGSMDKTAQIWDARTGLRLAVLSGHTDGVFSAAFSRDGTRIATASWDKSVRLWQASTSAQLTVLLGHTQPINSVAFSPDGTHLVTASYDRTARVWDARAATQVAVLSGHTKNVNSAEYSPDGSSIVTASDDRTARIWDARTGAQLATLSGHRDAVNFAAYSPDGTRIVTASGDTTARIWDARVPANLEAQILWYASAEIDPLPNVDRIQLGLLPDPRVRTWATKGSACDQAAAAVYDPDRLTPGALPENITVAIADRACSTEVSKPGHHARFDYQMGRTLLASGDVNGARRQLEIAVATGYRAARVDLADLLVNASARMLDPRRAASLYETAWKEGVRIAAFRLGHLYEYGLPAPEASALFAFHPDSSTAWRWYQRGADAGEPNALARFAEREERNALAETDPSKRTALLFQAFAHYAAAAERANNEDWPDDAWKNWRYRRATLARVLASEGKMQQVAEAYAAIGG